MRLTTHASAVARHLSVEALFDRVADPAAAGEFFRGFGPVPAIAEVRLLSPGPLAAGARREIVMADGSTLLEQVTEFDRPRRHRYRIERCGPPLSRLVSEAAGTWIFEPEGQGARVTWKYEYVVASMWVVPVALLFVKVLMHGAMRRAVARLCQPPPARS